MGQNLIMVAKLFLLCVILNLLRYTAFGFVEGMILMQPLFSAMEESRSYFNTDFQTMDWVTSYLSNFLMWLPSHT